MRVSTASKLKCALLALLDTLASTEFQCFVIGKVHKQAIKCVTRTIPEIDHDSFVLVRATKKKAKPAQPVYEQSRAQSMPPEWQGHQTTERIIVYHEAYKAGPHVEAYIVLNGIAYNIGVKRLRPEHIQNIKKHKDGTLTNGTKDYLVGVLRDEFRGGAWLGQTTDHTPEEAKTEWTAHLYNSGYGSGESRHVLDTRTVDVFKSGNTIEWRDSLLNPHQTAYVFRLMSPTERRPKPILKLGFKEHQDIEVKDRLHLKPHIGTHEFSRFRKLVGEDGIVTVKHDGASAYFEINQKGMSFWSPRVSKETGRRINYNAKVKDLIHHTSDKRITGMGELEYYDRRNNRLLKAHEVGGILNSNGPMPSYIEPQFIIYRIDKVDRKDIHAVDYRQNLDHIRDTVYSIQDPRIQAPILVDWHDAEEVAKSREGLVGVPSGLSILDGRKYKPRVDLYDWTVETIGLEDGPKGGISGVVWFTNEQGDRYKIGASSMGSRDEVKHIMDHPEQYIGKVAKVSSYSGHEGRAAKFEQWHLDKGVN